MMRCLEAGGLDPVVDDGFEIMNLLSEFSGYSPNPNGFYMIRQGEYRRQDFALEYDGKLLKCHIDRLVKLPPHAYTVVFMLRDPDEIIESMSRFDVEHGFGYNTAIAYLYGTVVPALIGSLSKRSDMRVLQVQYKDVVDNPIKVFGELELRLPIYATRAASMVDKKLYRNKREVINVVNRPV